MLPTDSWKLGDLQTFLYRHDSNSSHFFLDFWDVIFEAVLDMTFLLLDAAALDSTLAIAFLGAALLVPKTFVTYLEFDLIETDFFVDKVAFFEGAAFFTATGLAAFLASTFGLAGALLESFLLWIYFCSSFFFSAGFFASLTSFFASFSSTLRAYFRSLLFLLGVAALATGAPLDGVFPRALVSLAAVTLFSAFGASFLGASFLGSSFYLGSGASFFGAGAGDFEALWGVVSRPFLIGVAEIFLTGVVSLPNLTGVASLPLRSLYWVKVGLWGVAGTRLVSIAEDWDW